MTVRPRAIGHVGLMARDLETLVEFYVDVLGFQVADRMSFPDESPYDEGVWLRCNSNHHALSVFGLRGAHQLPETGSTARTARPGLHHIAFEMASLDDLMRADRHVRGRGAEIQGTRTGGPGVQLRLYVWDPEGNIVELFWGLDKIGWDGRSRPFPPVETVDLKTMDIEAWLEMKGPEFKQSAQPATPWPARGNER